jgi:glycosyltransferase involved in cell wall biosynthesis
MKFSVIMPSYLGEYRTAASDRDQKIVRAVNSVLNQTFDDFELIVVADGCEKTVDIVSTIKDDRINCLYIDKSKLWSGIPRNTGLEASKGDFITYLDIDDVFGKNHLKSISVSLNGYDWVWFDDIRYSIKSDEWYINPCDILLKGRHGTSNICHKKSLPYRWTFPGYAHDLYFVRNLRQNKNFKKIPGGEYYVCHVPDSNIGKGYDL